MVGRVRQGLHDQEAWMGVDGAWMGVDGGWWGTTDDGRARMMAATGSSEALGLGRRRGLESKRDSGDAG